MKSVKPKMKPTREVATARKLNAWIRGPTVAFSLARILRGSPAAAAPPAACAKHCSIYAWPCSSESDHAGGRHSGLCASSAHVLGPGPTLRLLRLPRMAASQARNMTSGTPTPARMAVRTFLISPCTPAHQSLVSCDCCGLWFYLVLLVSVWCSFIRDVGILQARGRA